MEQKFQEKAIISYKLEIFKTILIFLSTNEWGGGMITSSVLHQVNLPAHKTK